MGQISAEARPRADTDTDPGEPAAIARRLHPRPLDTVPRWIVLAAYAASLTTLPSGVWRIALGFGAPIGPPITGSGDINGDLPAWFPLWLYVIVLSIVAEALAFLTIGLISHWGEVFPRWIPFLRGRTVPTAFAVVTAGLGAIAVTLITFLMAPWNNEFTGPDGAVVHLTGWRLALFAGSYGPLLAWGPLLAIVTVAYYLRRTRRPAALTASQ